MMSLEINKMIKKFCRMDMKKAGYDYILSTFRDTINKLTIFVRQTRSTDLYFRARIKNDGKDPLNISEIASPPINMINGFQRCNPPNVSMFYASSKRITALLECNVKVGDIVYLGQWVNKKPLPVNAIMYPPMRNSNLSTQEQLIYNYIETIFTRPIHDTFSEQYKITAAITQALTTNFPVNQHDDIREDRTIGFIYPSTKNIEESHNTVFHADFANERLELCHVMKILVKSIDGDNIGVEVVDNAIHFPDGNIEWLNNPVAIPKIRDNLKELKFIYNGESWEIPIMDKMHTQIDIQNLLNEDANKSWDYLD